MPENRKNLASIALLTRLNERNYVTRNNRVTRLPLRNKHFNSGFCPFLIFFYNHRKTNREQRHKQRQKQRNTVNVGKPQKRTQKRRGTKTSSRSGGRDALKRTWCKCATRFPNPLTLFQTKISDFLYPVHDP